MNIKIIIDINDFIKFALSPIKKLINIIEKIHNIIKFLFKFE
tara:strand:+ start:380 stop:505 length:126 start_codon:yes stop_codon:yes gene_type:complete